MPFLVECIYELNTNFVYSAESGAYIRQPGGQWEDVFDNIDVSWKPAVMEVSISDIRMYPSFAFLT